MASDNMLPHKYCNHIAQTTNVFNESIFYILNIFCQIIATFPSLSAFRVVNPQHNVRHIAGIAWLTFEIRKKVGLPLGN